MQDFWVTALCRLDFVLFFAVFSGLNWVCIMFLASNDVKNLPNTCREYESVKS